MFELSLHILDLVQNAVRAGASLVIIRILYDTAKDQLTIELVDDGCGMDEALLKRVLSPFATTRTTRKVGLGIPMFQQLAQQCGGDLTLESQVGVGTTLTARFQMSSIDLPPLGDLPGTLRTLILGSPDKPDFLLEYSRDGRAFCLDTRQVRTALDGLSLAEPDILDWIAGYIREVMNDTDGRG